MFSRPHPRSDPNLKCATSPDGGGRWRNKIATFVRSWRLLCGSVLALMVAGCANNPPSQNPDERGTCGQIGQSCCDVAPSECNPGTTCGPGDRCCGLPDGAFCQSDGECCTPFVCEEGRCCRLLGNPCERDSDCCGFLDQSVPTGCVLAGGEPTCELL